jgi:ATP-binding cassette subfamily B protein
MSDAAAFLEKLPLFETLEANVRDAVVAKFKSIAFPFGSLIVREGEAADSFYLLLSGRARVIKRSEAGEEIALGVLRPGDSFGEAGLLQTGIRTASVRASGNCEVLRLDRAAFEELVAEHPEVRALLELQLKQRTLMNFFRRLPTFARLPAAVARDLADRLEEVSLAPGQTLVREGDEGRAMYVVREGRLRASFGDGAARRDTAFFRAGSFFGEDALLNGGRSPVNVEAVSACQLFALSREHFAELAERYAEFRAEMEEHAAQLDYRRTANVPLDFAAEILPAAAIPPAAVGDDQVEESQGESEDAPFASAEGFFIRKPGRIRRFPLVRQVDEMDCGAAALAMICRHFGRRVSLARIRQLAHTSLDGTSLRSLCSAATELGLAARSVKVSRQNLDALPLPVIVHWQGYHWIVLYDTGPNYVRVIDPALGRRRLARQQFDENWSGYAALFDYTTEFEKAPEDPLHAWWLWSMFRPHAATLVKAVLLAIVVAALEMVLPVFSQVIVDDVLVDRDQTLLSTLTVAMLALLGFSTLGIVIQRYLLSFVALHVDSASIDLVTRKLLALPVSYFATRRTGDIQRRIDGLHEVRQFAVQHGANALMAIVQLGVALAVMFAYSPLLAAVFLCMLPLYGGLMLFSRRRLHPMIEDLEEASSRYRSYQIDAIKGVETVKAMGAEGQFRELMLNEFLHVADKRFNADFTTMLYEGAVTTISLLSLVVFLWTGAQQVIAGKLTIGAFVAFNSLLALASQPILMLLFLWDQGQIASVLVNRLTDVFSQEPEQGEDRSRLKPVPSLGGHIRFENLSFRYGGPEAPTILEGITFEIEPGKRIAIVGRSGSGKTTLIKCLSGLLEPTGGTIYYDGVDLKTLNYRDLRRQIGFVLQENYLFSDTIARNVAFGEQEPDMDRVIAAARAANAHEFIERLPLGYDTRIGESGLALSGGQRQRIAIARAVYHQPPVLVFDEATSSLDAESERAVKENLDELLKDRTSIVIAHRLSTIRDADQIVVLEKGRLVENGTHDALMKLRGLYYYLVSQQLGL